VPSYPEIQRYHPTGFPESGNAKFSAIEGQSWQTEPRAKN